MKTRGPADPVASTIALNGSEGGSGTGSLPTVHHSVPLKKLGILVSVTSVTKPS